MVSMIESKSKTFSFRDLTVWSTKLPDVKFAILPSSNTRPNPLVAEGYIYASIFFPGAVCALDPGRGKLIWRHELGVHAGASVYLHGKKLFAKTSNTLFALQAETGEPLWLFCPYGTSKETIYSAPSARDDRVYIGDRRGYLHCLDSVNGKTIWRRLTNRSQNCSVNSTPILMDGLVIITTNASSVLAYDAEYGELAWKQKLDGPSTFGPLVHQGCIAAVTDSLYMLTTAGEIQRRFSWNGEKLCRIESTPRNIAVSFWPQSLWGKPDQLGKSQPGILRLLTVKSGLQQTVALQKFCDSIRYIPTTRLLYLSHLTGIDLLHATKRTVLCQIKTSKEARNGVALVDVSDNKIYALTGDGRIHALNHPTAT